MCRMIFAFGRNLEVDLLIDDFLVMARDQNEYHERNRGVKGGILHKDGWGVSYLVNDKWKLEKSIKPCYEDQKFLALKPELKKAQAIMIHARHASSGSIALENTHPFRGIVGGTEYFFCHNGSIEKKDWDKFEYFLEPKGNGDSERLFSHLLNGKISKDGISNSFSIFNNYSALNFILVQKNRVFTATWFKKQMPLYYQMKIIRLSAVTIISSEILKSFGKESDWKRFEDKKIIEEGFV